MRIVSLLPALTELVGYLGFGRNLVGVSHECDEPPDVARLPRLTSSSIDSDAPSEIINKQVAEHGGALYRLDGATVRDLRPDLILTQSQCDVCAVSEQSVREVATSITPAPRVLSVNPTDIAGVYQMFRDVADYLGPSAQARADAWIASMRAVAAEIAIRRVGLARPRVALLEWLDPLFCAGHWNPELVELAGGVEVLGSAGGRSRAVSWAELTTARPDVVVVAPCGFTLARAETEIARLAARPEWQSLLSDATTRVVIADGNALFSRPGPRLAVGVRIVAAAIDDRRCGDLASSIELIWRVWT